MSLTIVHSLDERVWQQFVDHHPQGNVFHTPEMFHVFSRAKGYRPTLWAAVDGRGQLLALLLPVQVTLSDGVLRRLTTRSIAYGSVLCTLGQAGTDAVALLLHTYTREAGGEAVFSELRNQSDLSAIQPVLNQCGFVYEDHLDYLIDLRCSSEQVLQGIGPRTRKHIRRASRKGNVRIEQITDRSQMNAWYDLVHKTYRAARVPLADASLFQAAFDILQPRGMITFWLAHIGAACVAASAELVYKDVIYGWYSGVDRAYVAEMPGEVLMWHVLQWGCENGYETYDFGGAGKPDEPNGVRDFKAKFGGRLVCYGRNTCVHAPGLLRLSTAGYGIYRRLFN